MLDTEFDYLRNDIENLKYAVDHIYDALELLFSRIEDLEMKSPYDKQEDKRTKRAFEGVKKSLKPVDKDTNKTRRKMVKPTSRPTKA